VRVNRRDLIAEPWHASRHDVCDLPTERVAASRRPGTRCYWILLGDAKQRTCSCELCYGSTWRRLDIRRLRRRTHQRLDAGRRRGGAGVDDLSGPYRRRDWWR
jgi:hypothetical protein